MLYSVKQIRQIEHCAYQQLDPGTLMQSAGAAAANYAEQLLNDVTQHILVLAGPGNNGGDALVAALHLANRGHQVSVHHLRSTHGCSTEATLALQQAQACTKIIWLADEFTLNEQTKLVIDGLFGIGLSQNTLTPTLSSLIHQINRWHGLVLALDIPSGLDADTGQRITPVAIEASHTLTFIGDKPGLHTCDGRDYAGIVTVNTLQLDAQCYPASTMEINQPALFPAIFTPRRHNSNKGSNGSVHLLGGADGMQGALILAARAALVTGAGRTIAGFVGGAPQFDPLYPEVMCRPALNSTQASDITVIGPGLGKSIASFELVSRALLDSNLLVLDADALNLMAHQPALMALCNGRAQLSTLLTPHPLEAARLLTCNVEEIQQDRPAAAKKLARRYAAVVILKGSGSIIAHPDGRLVINATGNPGLASGGSGDVLAGVCGALLAQYRDVWQSALGATWLHGAAADRLVSLGVGDKGLTPSELLPVIRSLLNDAMPRRLRPNNCS